MFSLQGKNAFITGGRRGIGRAVAVRFIQAGARVVIADIEDGSDVAEEIGATFVGVNVGNEESVAGALAQAAERFGGRLDIVCNNAGVGDIGPKIEETEQWLIEKVTRINQWGVLYGLKHAPAHMNDGGSIINTSSAAAFKSMIGTAVYSAAKKAVLSLTSMSALELGGRSIRVNAVCPGYIDTDMGSGDEGENLSKALKALGRIGTIDDITGVFHFLAADESAYITGQSIIVDGGMMAGPPAQLLKQIIGRDRTIGE